MNQINYDRFVQVYAKHLAACMQEFPDDYIVRHVVVVLERMKAAIARGSYNKDSVAFRRTCKELGIKHTYRAINAYVGGR